MTATLHRTFVLLVRVIITTLINAVALYLTSLIIPGMDFFATNGNSLWLTAVAAAILLGLVNLLIRPIILLVARPLGFFALFIVGFLVNAVVLVITANLLPGFELNGILSAIIAGIVFGAINTVISGALELDDDNSYYQQRIERQAAKSPFPAAKDGERGLIMMEIDGLSYHHLHHALDEGLMPHLSKLIEEEGYQLNLVDCGIPSQTSACQAGIMFGNNDEIPAFRWYDKEQQKLIVSSKDAGELNRRYARGEGLMRAGSSISNMLNGDAYKSLITAADLRVADKEESERRAKDVYLLMLHPLFMLRMLAMYFGMVILELWQGFKQRIGKVEPRLNRLEHGYPFVRAATSVVLRDLGAEFTLLDIARGTPSLYITWPGYDEVAHHSGPWTDDAMGELKRYDRVIARIHRAIKERAPRPYDLIILSDHGQSFGPTFKQRYGLTIKELIEQQLPAGTTVTTAIGGDTGSVSIGSMGAELQNVANSSVGGSLGKSVAKQGAKLSDRALLEEQAREAASARPAQVTAFGSGNLAQVYFDLFPRKITLTELNAAYPGVVDALLCHEGIGLVCGYLDDGTPIALGKEGTRNLHTGEVNGKDPLASYAPSEGYGVATVEKRAWQVRKVMDFRSAGDLMVISTVYADGSVAALEELIGSHGGVGGEQTDAFIFHPPDMPVMETRNSTDVFTILNAYRAQPWVEQKVAAVEPQESDWSIGALLGGIALVGTWLAHVGRCLIPDYDAFKGVVKDRRMTGPAILIALVTSLLFAVVTQNSYSAVEIVLGLGLWVATVVVVHAAAVVLRGKGSFTDTVRAMGFARSPYLLLVLGLYQPIAAAVILITSLMTLLGILFGVSAAHQLRGWKALLVPLVAVLVFVIGAASFVVFINGARLTIEGVMQTVGFMPQP